jgi:hypothetical protein
MARKHGNVMSYEAEDSAVEKGCLDFKSSWRSCVRWGIRCLRNNFM